MVLWIFVVHDTRIFCYVIYLTLLWANEPIQGLACHIEATVLSEPGCYRYGRVQVSSTAMTCIRVTTATSVSSFSGPSRPSGRAAPECSASSCDPLGNFL